MIQEIKKIGFQIIHLIWSLFLNGLLTLLPITLTFAIFHVTFRIVKNWLEPIAAFHPPFVAWIPHVEIFIVIASIFLFGAILRFILLKQIIHFFESQLMRLPLIRPVYTGIKQLVAAFHPNNMMSFKKIVFIQFPRTGLYSVGFLTSDLAPELSPEKGIRYFNVFIPTTPNPTSGYFVLVPEKEILVTDLTRQEAMAMVISGGIIQPERFNSKER